MAHADPVLSPIRQKLGMPGPGRPKGLPNLITREFKAFMRDLLDDPEYRESMRKRFIAGECPQLEAHAWMHVLGKPKDTVELSVVARNEFASMSVEELTRVAERVLDELRQAAATLDAIPAEFKLEDGETAPAEQQLLR